MCGHSYSGGTTVPLGPITHHQALRLGDPESLQRECEEPWIRFLYFVLER